MKNLAIVILILGVLTISIHSKASDGVTGDNHLSYSEYGNRLNQNPWHTFKKVVNTFYTANGEFQKLSKEEQTNFIQASEIMKARISVHKNRFSADKLKRIDLAVNIFKFVWEDNKAPIEIDANIAIPTVPILG